VGKALSGRAFLEKRLGLDLQELELDQLVIFWQVSKAGESLASFGFAAVVAQPARAERHEDLHGLVDKM
jgi:hypothetical protein